jgi:hypothetical protein
MKAKQPLVIGLIAVFCCMVWLVYKNSAVGNGDKQSQENASVETANPHSLASVSPLSSIEELAPKVTIGKQSEPVYSSSDQMPRDKFTVFKRGNLAREYAKIIQSFGLSDKDRERLIDFLVEREEAARDTRELVRNSADNVSLEEYKAMLAKIDAQLFSDLNGYFGAPLASKIKDMVMVRSFITDLNTRYDPYLNTIGHPLQPEQMLPVALAMAETYKSRGNPETRATPDNVDPNTGLTPYDAALLKKLSQLLTPEQLEAVSTQIVDKNSIILRSYREQQSYVRSNRNR